MNREVSCTLCPGLPNGNILHVKRRGWQRMRWLDSINDSMDINFSKLRDIAEDRGAWYATVLGVAKSQTRLRD